MSKKGMERLVALGTKDAFAEGAPELLSESVWALGLRGFAVETAGSSGDKLLSPKAAAAARVRSESAAVARECLGFLVDSPAKALDDIAAAAVAIRRGNEGALFVSLGSSPDKACFLVEAEGERVVYVPFSRSWIPSTMLSAQGMARMRASFKKATAAIVEAARGYDKVVLVDFMHMGGTLSAVLTLLRDTNPELEAKTHPLLLFSRADSSPTAVNLARMWPRAALVEIPSEVWAVSKMTRCLPALGDNTPAHPALCNAVRLLLAHRTTTSDKKRSSSSAKKRT